MPLALPALPHVLSVALLGAAVAAAVSMGHDGRRAAQVMTLAVPFLAWLFWPMQRPAWARLRAVLVSTALMAFALDGIVRHHLQQHYDATPDSSLVVAAAANTTVREAQEYVVQMARPILLAALALIAAAAIVAVLSRTALSPPVAPTGMVRRLLLGAVALALLCHLFKPWRKHHPLLFWPAWMAHVVDFRQSLEQRQQARDRLLHNARMAAPTVAREAPATIVLVLSESINRDNMSLYGYPRATTPQLDDLQESLGERLLVLRHAWSTEPGTLASLARIFGFGRPHEAFDAPDAQHLLALARAAGYRTWWISNHDDIGIERQHAQLADVAHMANRQPGRSTTSLDGTLLDDLQQALLHPTRHKLVVLHLLGAHPHYSLRRPDGPHPFDGDGDTVDDGLARQGRPAWLRQARQDYDAAIRYHDTVVAETLRLTMHHSPAPSQGAWMFISDHGQEVGHEKTHAGHSPGTAAGYRIPALVWRGGASFDASIAQRPFRADWAAWTLADLLQLRWNGDVPAHNVLDSAYRWQPPSLPIAVRRFDE